MRDRIKIREAGSQRAKVRGWNNLQNKARILNKGWIILSADKRKCNLNSLTKEMAHIIGNSKRWQIL